MPLYELFLVVRPNLTRPEVFNLAKTYTQQILSNDGIVTGLKYFGKQPLAKKIRTLLYKRVYREALMLQLHYMQAPQHNFRLRQEIQKDDRIYRWNILRYQAYGPRLLDDELLESYAKLMLLEEDSRKGTEYAGLPQEEAARVMESLPKVDIDNPDVRERIGIFGEPIAPRLLKRVSGPHESDKQMVDWNRPV